MSMEFGQADNPAGGGLTYTYRPSLMGAPWTFTLTGDSLEWSAGSKFGRVAWRNIRRLRMSYRPASLQSHRFVTELWADNTPKLQIMSTSWKSMVEQERLDRPYSAFVTELHRRIMQAGADPQFEQGSNPLLYWPGLVLFAGMVLALLLLIVRALQADAASGAAFIGAFLALFLWQSGNYFRRNRPGVYHPDALPSVLMPKG